MNKITNTVGNATSNLSAFERMEAKADKMLDEANAMAELNAEPKDEVDDLMSKYDEGPSADVEDELAALKAKLGM